MSRDKPLKVPKANIHSRMARIAATVLVVCWAVNIGGCGKKCAESTHYYNYALWRDDKPIMESYAFPMIVDACIVQEMQKNGSGSAAMTCIQLSGIKKTTGLYALAPKCAACFLAYTSCVLSVCTRVCKKYGYDTAECESCTSRGCTGDLASCAEVPLEQKVPLHMTLPS